MVQKFQAYIREHQLFHSTERILLTVSGGRDSIFMVHLFLKANLNFGIAHCNFKLRGNEADLDEQFVEHLAKQHHIEYHTINFNTQEYSKKEGVSIQMAARKLRYEWFEKIRVENNYASIATAHHKNDVAETMLINLIKGTGLAGLHGINNNKGKIIRPILCFTRLEIDQFILEEKIVFREDQSNNDVKYTRNKVRHRVIPELEKINPSVIETLNNEAEQFLGLEKIIQDKIDEERVHLFQNHNDSIKIAIDKLKKLNPLTSYLYLLLRDYGFNKANVEDIIPALDGNSGKGFYSSTHQLIKDRDFLLLQELKEEETSLFVIEKWEDLKKIPLYINHEIKIYDLDTEIQKSKCFAYLDYDKIQFPIILRKWKEGDIFQPFGMKGKKKISDYFIDNKIAISVKKEKWILEANNQIVWLVGERIDDNYKLTNQSKSMLVLHLKD